MIQLIRSSIPIDILEEIITLGEGYKTDLKETLPEPIEIAKSICAFSNTKGGNILIGISSNGKATGVENMYEEVAKVEKSLSLIIPLPSISAQTVNFRNKEILLIEVKEGDRKPYYVSNGKQTTAYIRTGDGNTPASRKTLKPFIKKRASDLYMAGEFKRRELKRDEKIILDLLDRFKKITASQITEQVGFREKRVKRVLFRLQKMGYISPAKDEKHTYIRIEETLL
jgi:predicted HTH transcriptional regulator